MIKWILIGLFVVIVAIAILVVAIINDADEMTRTMIEGIIFYWIVYISFCTTWISIKNRKRN